jgi:hypothetical protein
LSKRARPPAASIGTPEQSGHVPGDPVAALQGVLAAAGDPLQVLRAGVLLAVLDLEGDEPAAHVSDDVHLLAPAPAPVA